MRGRTTKKPGRPSGAPRAQASASASDGDYQCARQIYALARAIESGDVVTTASAVKRFGIPRARAYRYVQVAASLVGATGKTAGGRQVWRRDRDSEVLALQAVLAELGERAFPWLAGTRYIVHLQELIRDLRGSLNAEQRARVDHLVGAVHFKHSPVDAPSRWSATVATLLDAIRDGRRCRFEYQKLDGTLKQYAFEPWSLAIVHGAACAIGRKVPDGVRRTFEVSGIRGLIVEETTFVAPHAAERDIAGLLAASIGTYGLDYAEPQPVVLSVRGAARARLARRPLHVTQSIDDERTEWAALRLKAVVCPELVGAVLSLLPDVRVVSPDALREAVHDAIAAAPTDH